MGREDSSLSQGGGVLGSASPVSSPGWLARNWLHTFLLVYGLWVILPWLAPVMMQIGQDEPGKAMATLQTGEENWYAILRITTQEQLDLIQRVLNSHVDNMNLSMQGDTSRNYRRTLGSLFGDQNDQ